jgi:glutamate carboxypeptidase
LLEQLVNIDSGTGDVEGGRKVAAVLKPRLEALGMTVELVPAEAPGLPENLVARLVGSGRGRILLIGHLDTVFDPGTAAARPYRTDATKAYGPGVGDEKGGVVNAVEAVQILKTLGFNDFKSITLLVESSEERGSPGTRALIGRLLADADVELNLEPGEEPDGITVWRKGSNNFLIDVKGRAAHAGVAPQDGRNAALELIHQLQGLEGLPKTGEGVTVNLTLLNAGSRYNIIPETAQATLNVRIRQPAEGDAIMALLEKNARTTLVPETTVTVRREISFPPLPSNPATDALAARAQAIYAGLGMTLATGGNGGASESALAAEAGVAAQDGLGPSGGGYHTAKEYINRGRVTPRLYLLTRLMMDLGRDPPPRAKGP